MGVWYDPGTLAASVVLRDLQAIRALGFNHVRTPVEWAIAEPSRGGYRFEALEQFLTLADRAGIDVIVQPQIDAAPTWVDPRGVDSTLVASLVEQLTSRAARHRSFRAVDAVRDPYRVSMYPRPSGSAPWPAVQLAWSLEAIRSAAGNRGWSVGEMQASDATAADVRLWTWAAIARGAHAITYASWSPASAPGGSRDGLAGADGTITDRARAAGELAGLLSRNAALFAPLRPRPSRVAILYNPSWAAADAGASAIAHAVTWDFFSRLFASNVQTDILLPDDVLIGKAGNYAVVFAAVPEMLPRPVAAALDTYVRAGGKVTGDPRSDVAAVAGIQPDVRVDGGSGAVETRWLTSVDTLVLIGLNHADTAQTVTFTFPPDTPEAIWQNMETGASVSFVQGPAGLTYRHAFAPRDAMVLMIRTRLR